MLLKTSFLFIICSAMSYLNSAYFSTPNSHQQDFKLCSAMSYLNSAYFSTPNSHQQDFNS